MMETVDQAQEHPDVAAELAPEPIERLRELGRAMGNEVPHRIIELFLSDAPERLSEIEQAHLAGDSKALGAAAHSLRGSSANLGASSLAELCQLLEREPADTAARESRLAAARAEYGRVDVAMRRLLAEFA